MSIIESQGTSAEDLIARYSQESAFDRYVYTFRLNSLTLELQMMHISLYGFTRSTNADIGSGIPSLKIHGVRLCRYQGRQLFRQYSISH